MDGFYERLAIPENALNVVVDREVLDVRIKSLAKLGSIVFRHLRFMYRSMAQYSHKFCAENLKATMWALKTQGYFPAEEVDHIHSNLERIRRALFLMVFVPEEDPNFDQIYEEFSVALIRITTRQCYVSNS